MTISCPRSHGTLSLSLRASRRTKLIAAWGWDLVSSASGMLFGHVSSVPDREPWHENNSLDEVHFQVEDTLNGYLFRCPWWLVRQVPFVCIGWESAFGGGGLWESQITGIWLRDFYVITNRFQSIPPLSSTWLIEDETLYGLFTQRPLLNTHWPLLLYPQDKTNAKNRHRGQYCPFLPIWM